MTTLDTYPTELDDVIREFFHDAALYGPPRIDLEFHGYKFGTWDKTNHQYVIYRDTKKHFFREWRSYGVSEAILKGLRSQAVDSVKLIEHGVTGAQTYIVNLERFFNSGLRRKNEVWPHEWQLHVALKDWTPLTGRWNLRPDGTKEWKAD